jgi:hypothetical protein
MEAGIPVEKLDIYSHAEYLQFIKNADSYIASYSTPSPAMRITIKCNLDFSLIDLPKQVTTVIIFRKLNISLHNNLSKYVTNLILHKQSCSPVENKYIKYLPSTVISLVFCCENQNEILYLPYSLTYLLINGRYGNTNYYKFDKLSYTVNILNLNGSRIPNCINLPHMLQIYHINYYHGNKLNNLPPMIKNVSILHSKYYNICGSVTDINIKK